MLSASANRIVTKIFSPVENATALDPLISTLQKAVRALVPPGEVRDVLHGVPAAHPVHPVLVQIPLGSWTSAAILDLVPGTESASRRLICVGVLAAAPAALTGATDWSELHEQQMRTGVVHWAANLVAVSLYAASYVQRRRGRDGSGKVLSYLGLAVASAGGFIGGHLAYHQAAGVNHAEEVPHIVPSGWNSIGTLEDFAEGRVTRSAVGDVPILVFRDGERLSVLSDRCSHLSGPLSEGDLVTDADGSACIRCPWHGSTFSLADGSVRRGPAIAPQPALQARQGDGRVEVMLPGAD
ncbi:Rieske 2Fe-2S domain-containing protein [Leifsonia sp. Leaf264]|uniref:Rieske 2Fe-2S domain-containing protein n=1 Tax=Leifsonia sp. Leaf264 TaxID=1736314 RepID=UPI0007015E5B|nr:Rieske 2Fe-2S domain-containing protein [Leifsonia sp. Leaf264]KQO97663.1 (2Fe-2S)-binding protein [Leifsonia sp. Leaf264]